MRKVVRLTERDLTRLVKRIVKESSEMDEYFYPDEKKGRAPYGKSGVNDKWIDADDYQMGDEPNDYSEERHFGPDEYEDFMEFINDCDTKWCLTTKKYYDMYAERGGLTVRK